MGNVTGSLWLSSNLRLASDTWILKARLANVFELGRPRFNIDQKRATAVTISD